ncbi:MAG: hypothetical protein ACQEQB_07740 [Bacteroidota bacterium]
MVENEINERPVEAKILMDAFALRTGLQENGGNSEERYLWTDAFAVQTFFGLYHTFGEVTYKDYAFKLIDRVHETLGSYHPDDTRTGKLSGLSGDEARKHPTAGGLRIGKKLPERLEEQSFNERLEWERDGQYFHYITRWIHALLQAGIESGEKKYTFWAAELLLAADKFIYSSGTGLRMYWKMSTDLSRPLVTGMGGHDPLEGLVCAVAVNEAIPEKAAELEPITLKFYSMCKNQYWATSDSLGIGGLLLNTVKAASLEETGDLPPSSKPKRLLEESIESLEDYQNLKEFDYDASRRLAFRECGLSLGLRSLHGAKEDLLEKGMAVEKIEDYLYLAEEIEKFWKEPSNQQVSTWIDHLNINAVSLAASLVARTYPEVFSGKKRD